MRREGLLAAVLLGLTGGCVLVGALLHPRVPAAMADQMRMVAGSRLWVPAHWTLTFGQAAAVPVLALALRQASRRVAPLAVAGGVALALGLAVGTLGTLLAATGLHAAAAQQDAAGFATVAAFDLGLGWMCLLLAGAGVLCLGLSQAAAGVPVARWLARVAVAASFLLLAAAALTPYDHWWMHQYVLRSGALLLGAGLLALAAIWPTALRAGLASRP
ncbi:MAG: hypothetical protein QOI63_1560 [Thermoplasmata archaeon]|nr:hypothetical protein [Thermoplasmata archaeon]